MNSKLLFLILLGLSFYELALCQKQKLEPTPSNFNRLMAIEHPSEKGIDSIIELSIQYSYTNEDTCLILGKRALELSMKYENTSIHAKAMMELGDSYRIFGRLEEAEKLLQDAKALFEQQGALSQAAAASNKLGALNVNKSNYDIAIEYYLFALNTWTELKDSQNIIKPYINIGVVFKNLNRNSKAEEYYIEALKWADVLNDNRAKMYVYNNQAIIYNAEAEQYQTMAETDSIKRKIFKDSSRYFTAKALNKYQQSLDLSKSINDKRNMLRALSNMVDLKTTMGLYHEALQHSLEAEAISKDIGATVSIVSLKANQTEVYRYLKQYGKGLQAGKEALALAEEHDLGKFGATANLMLYEIYKVTGQSSNALEHYEAYSQWNMENSETERNKAIAEIETRYQTVQKENQILEQQNEIMTLEESQARIKKQRNIWISSVLGLGLFGFLGMQILRIRRERNDKKAFAEALLYTQEEERKRIARDLHDGVGQSLLLIQKQLENTQETSQKNQELIAETLDEVRSISRDLHPFKLEKFGLTIALGDLLEKMGQSTGLFISKELEKVDDLLSEKAEINIFRTIQEGMNNIVKHAEASAAKLSLKRQNDIIILKIRDNGQGFDYELAVVKSKSLGLKTMAERMEALGGTFRVVQAEPKGTIIECVIPVKGNTK